MIDGRLHLYFNSQLDDPEQWRVALTRLMGPLVWSVGTDCDNPATVDVALLWTTPEQGLASFTQLRAVLSLGAGINQLNLSSLVPGVPLARLVDDSLAQTMVEYARTAVLRYHRYFHCYEKESRSRTWAFRPPTPAHARCIGVLGLGQLGLAIAQALVQDGFRVLGWSQTSKDLPGVESFSDEHGLAKLARQVDILINVLPLTEATRGILNTDVFAHFTRPVKLINIGRGEHLVEADLLQALGTGQIDGVTLDVTGVEPLPKASLLWDHPDILITPHVAGLSSPDSAAARVAKNIRLAMQSRPLLHQVNLAKGY